MNPTDLDAAARKLVLAAAELVRGVPTIENLASALLQASGAVTLIAKCDTTGKARALALGQLDAARGAAPAAAELEGGAPG